MPAPDEEPPHRRRARLTWARLVKKIYEVDPLLCSYCGSEMKIIAFVVEHASVRRILRHLGRPPQRPEPLANSPPEELDLDFEPPDIPA